MEEQTFFQDIFFILLYGGVTMLDVMAAMYLFLRQGNAIAPEVNSSLRLRRWTAAFLCGAALSHIMWFQYALYPSLVRYMVVCCLDTIILLVPLSGALLSMLQDRRRPLWPILVALAPMIIVMVFAIFRKDLSMAAPLRIWFLVLYALFSLYMVISVRRYGRWLKDNYADLEHKEVWKSLLVLAVFLLFFLVYGSGDDGSVYRYFIQIDNIVIVVLLLWRVETLQLLNEDTPEETAEEESSADVQKAPPAIRSNIGVLLEKRCEEGQLFLQHDLTLAQLAQSIGTNRYYLSQHFARQGLTYNAYINGLRIRHFIRLYHEAVESERSFTALQLAYDSGFHSYSTFSAAFKQNMGKTVTAWMHETAK